MLQEAILRVADAVLGWLLLLPTDVALLVVAGATGATLAFVRVFTTDQDMLRRVAADRKRLKELIRAAKKRGDKEAIGRHRATIGMLGPSAMMAELKPLLASLPAIVFLAVWAFARLGFIPPEPGEPVEVIAYFSLAATGEIVHVAPIAGLSAPEGWVRRVAEDPTASRRGRASWTLTAERRDEPYLLEIRHGGRTYRKELIVDSSHYSPPVELYDGDGLLAVELGLSEYRPFRFVPGVPWIRFPPWLVGYLVMAIPLAFTLRRLFGVY